MYGPITPKGFRKAFIITEMQKGLSKEQAIENLVKRIQRDNMLMQIEIGRGKTRKEAENLFNKIRTEEYKKMIKTINKQNKLKPRKKKPKIIRGKPR